MKTAYLLFVTCPLWLPLSTVSADQETVTTDTIELLRMELQQMRSEYEARIASLEQRLDAADKESPVKQVSRAENYASGTPALANSSFNPAIGVIFQGQAWSYGDDPDEYEIPGFPLGGEAGLAPEGLSLAETEIDISANVDDKFTAWLTVPLVIEDGDTHIEIEEAWIETMGLPAGWSLRMGRFFSNIGYLNEKHAHSWDFADQPLAYQAFLGNQFIDDGLQFRWLLPTDFYLELSTEITRGDRYPAGGSANSGVGAQSFSAKTGGDVGISHSWLAGVSWLSADSIERSSGDEDDPFLFTGGSDLWIANFVWKWSPNGNARQRNFKFQAEYLRRKEDGFFAMPDGQVLSSDIAQQAWYAQAVFQPFPRWRVGARYDHLSSDTPEPGFAGTALYPSRSNPERYSLMVDWSNSEFGRVRFQYNLDDAGADNDHQFGLQYIFSIGAHGAHSF